MSFFSQAADWWLNRALYLSACFNDGVTLATFPNGIKFASQPRLTSKRIYFSTYILTGGMDDSPGKEGAAHFLEHVLYPAEFSRNLKLRKGIINASTGPFYMSVYGSIENNPDNLNFLLNGLEEILTAPVREKDYKRELNRIRNEIGVYADQMEKRHWERLSNVFDQTMYFPTTTIGSRKSLETITLEDLNQFKQAHFTGPNIALAFLGNVRQDMLRNTLQKRLEKIPAQTTPRKIRIFNPVDFRETSKDPSQLYFGYIFPCNVKTREEDYLAGFAMRYLNEKLVAEILEERGLVYHIESGGLTFVDHSGFLSIRGNMLPEDAYQITPEIAKIIAEAAHNLDKDTFEAVKHQGLFRLEGKRAAFWFSHHDDEQLASSLTETRSVTTVYEDINSLRKLTANDVQAFFAKLVCQKPAIVAYGNSSRLHSLEEFTAMLAAERAKYGAIPANTPEIEL